jgi:hypothetical protein
MQVVEVDGAEYEVVTVTDNVHWVATVYAHRILVADTGCADLNALVAKAAAQKSQLPVLFS